jgi:hypothetical protein
MANPVQKIIDVTENYPSALNLQNIVANFTALFGTAGGLASALGTFTSSTTPAAVSVAAPSITANSVILITLKTKSGTPVAQVIQTITPGTGFTVEGAASGDTSVYNYRVIG